MSDSAAASDIVTVGRMQCRYAIASGSSDIEATRRRLQGVVEQRVSERCATMVDGFDLDVGAVYRVRRVQVRTWVDVNGMSDHVIAGRWASALSGALQRELAAGPATNVVRFDSPLEFVAAFVGELPSGMAWQRWWFDEFRHFESVPPGEVIMHLLAHRPAWIGPVLADSAARRQLQPVIQCLTRPQAEQLWRAVVGDADRPTDDTIARVSSVVRQIGIDMRSDPIGRIRARLVIWAEMARTDVALVELSGVATAIALAVDVSVLLRRRPEIVADLRAARTDDESRRLLEARGFADLAGWLAYRPASIDHLGARATGPRTPEQRFAALVDLVDGDVALRSLVGGAALVLPALAELGLWDEWVATDGRERASDYVYVVMLKVLGRTRALLALGDLFLTTMSGCEAPPDVDARLATATDVGPPPWARLTTANDGELSLVGVGFAWLTPSLDDALSDVADQAVSRTAMSLGRFSRSSRQYLAAVLFAQPATYRPDLGLVMFDSGVLGQTGILGRLVDGSVNLPWFDEPLTFQLGRP